MTETAAPPASEPVVLDLRKTDRRVELDLLIPPKLFYFQGHFPEFPVLPGVVQLHWSIAFGRLYFDLGESPQDTIQVKFKSIIVPNERICLILNYEAQRKKLSFEYRDAVSIRSSGVIAFAP